MKVQFRTCAAAFVVLGSLAACEHGTLDFGGDYGAAVDMAVHPDLARTADLALPPVDLVVAPDMTQPPAVCPQMVNLVDTNTWEETSAYVPSYPVFESGDNLMYDRVDEVYDGWMYDSCGGNGLLLDQVGISVTVTWQPPQEFPDSGHCIFEVYVGQMTVGHIYGIGGGPGMGVMSSATIWEANGYPLDRNMTEMTVVFTGCLEALESVHALVETCVGTVDFATWRDKTTGVEYSSYIPHTCKTRQF